MPNLLLTDPAQPVAPRQATPEAFGSEIGQEMQRLGHATNLLGQTVAHVVAQTEHTRGRVAANTYEQALNQAVEDISLDPDIGGRLGRFEKTSADLARTLQPKGLGNKTFSERADYSHAAAKVLLLGRAAKDGIEENRSNTRNNAMYEIQLASSPSVSFEESLQHFGAARLAFAESGSAFTEQEQIKEFQKVSMEGLWSMHYSEPGKVIQILKHFNGTLGPDGALMQAAKDRVANIAEEGVAARKAKFDADTLYRAERKRRAVDEINALLEVKKATEADIDSRRVELESPTLADSFKDGIRGKGPTITDRKAYAALVRKAMAGEDVTEAALVLYENKKIDEGQRKTLMNTVFDNTVKVGFDNIERRLKPIADTPELRVQHANVTQLYLTEITRRRAAGEKITAKDALELSNVYVVAGQSEARGLESYQNFSSEAAFQREGERIDAWEATGQYSTPEARARRSELAKQKRIFLENANRVTGATNGR